MKPINHILVRLSDKIGTTFQQLKSGLLVDFTYNPGSWVPSYGEVVESCTPEIKQGDIAYIDYHSVLVSLGIRYNTGQNVLLDNKYIEEDGVLSIFVRPEAVFFVMRDNELVPVNGNEIIVPIFKDASDVLKTDKEMTSMCNVLTGEYKGKTMVFRKQRMRSCGKYGFDSKDFYVIDKQYLLAEVTDEDSDL